MKGIKKLLGILLVVVCINSAVTVRAYEQSEVTVTKMDRLMTVTEYTDAKADPDERAEIVLTYEKGASVYVIGETSNGWYQISYQGKVGYVMKEVLETIDVDWVALAKEMDNEEMVGKIVVEEMERTRKEDERTSSWIAILAFIIGGMFITGILISSVSSKRRKRRRRRKR